MGASFKVELQELEQARTTLQNLLQDVFSDTASALHPVTFQNNTASSIQQGQYSSAVYHVSNMNDGQVSSNFGPMDQGIPAISTLNSAHGAAHAAIISLVNDLNTLINALSDRTTKTHQVYSQTEDVLHVKVANIGTNV